MLFEKFMLSLSVKEFHKSHLAKLEGKVEWYVFADAMYSLQITFSIGLPNTAKRRKCKCGNGYRS